MTRLLRRGLAAALLVAAPALPVEAQAGRGFAHEGVYVGAAGMFDFTLDGVSFNGRTFYKAVNRDDLVILPQLDKQDLRRIVVGSRARPVALEFSYDRTRHGGTFVDLTGEAVVTSFNIDLKVFAFTGGRIQPHGVIGLGFPRLTVEEGAFLEPDQVADAKFTGQGLNLEGGVTLFLHPRVGASVGYSYRTWWFNRVRGVSEENYRLEPRFRETAGSAVVMGFFTF